MTITRKIIILAFSLLALFSLEYLGILSGMNTYFYDLAFRIRGAREPLQRIVVVAIDEKTLETLGRWPLKRSLYASVLERTAAADVVAFDIMMVEPTPDDAVLARKMRAYGKAVLPVSIETGMTIADPAPDFAPLPVGHVHIEQGIDGVVREVYHTLYFQGRRLPSFASRIYEIAGKSSFHREAPFLEQQDAGDIVQGDLMRINYCGGPGTFRQLSFLDVVNGVYPRDYFRGKIVLVGITAMGLVDSATTPYSETRRGAAGVEIQANILNNLFTGNAISVVPLNLRVLIGGVLGLFMYLIFFRIPEGQGAILLTAVLTACSIVAFLLFSRWHVWYGPFGTYLILTTMLALAYIFKLNDAALSLGRTYDAIRPHLRNAQAKEMPQLVGAGLSGILTPRGIQTQAFVLNDITHSLIFEKELSDRILMSDIFGVAVFDPDGRIVITNEDVRRFCRANAIFLDSLDSFMAGLAPHILEKGDMGFALESRLEKASMTVSLSKPDKRYLKADLSRLPVGEKKYALVILSDITKLKEVEILKGQIVSIVTHELKAPMTSIQGFSEILTENLEGPMQRFATIIHDESLRLAKFVNTFLDINRIEEGRQQLNLSSVGISELVEDAAGTLMPLAERKGMKLRVEKPDKIAFVRADRDLAKQCIMNLTENAMKYSPENRDVTLRVEETAQHVRVDIQDQGYGIKAQDLDRIFEKFFRSSSEETEGIKGSGLGLTFVKEAVEAQGGRIAVASTYGEGSTFSLYFPKAG